MAYDLSGLNPTSEEGRRYSGGLFHWIALIGLCSHYFPEVTVNVAHWYGPKCYGNELDSRESLRLASKLETLIADGEHLLYAERHPDSCSACDEECLREFVRFLKSCGGFAIS